MNILIIGESHTAALRRGQLALEGRGELPTEETVVIRQIGGGHLLVEPFWKDAENAIEIVHPLMQKHMPQVPPAGQNFDVIGLSMPLWPGRVFHRMVASEVKLPGSSGALRTISFSVFREIVLDDLRFILSFGEALGRLGFKVCAISPPTLFRDFPGLQRVSHDYAVAVFDTYRSIASAELAKRKIAVVNFPVSCLDAEGFMLPKYRHPDPTDSHHANEEFGILMLRQIVDWARKQ